MNMSHERFCDAAPIPLASTAAAVWRRVGRRGWAVGLGVGLLLWLLTTTELSLAMWSLMPQARIAACLLLGSRWLPHMLLLALLMTYGLALLDDAAARGRPPGWRARALLVAVVTLLVLGVGDPLSFLAVKEMYRHVSVPLRAFWEGMTPPQVLFRLWSRGLPSALVITAAWTLVHQQLGGTRGSERELHGAQRRIAELQRRALQQQLQALQASIEPQLLFDAIAAVRQRLEQAPHDALALLRALIRFLRAAMPPDPEMPCTLGQEAALVQAYVLLHARLRGGAAACELVLLAPLSQQPLAPGLLLPLAAWLLGAARAPQALVLTASRQGRSLLISLRAEAAAGLADGAPLQAARQRLQALYGDGARLVLEAAAAQGPTRIDIHLGDPA